MPKYEFSMFTDNDFEFTYYGNETKYCDSLRILFETSAPVFTPQPTKKLIIKTILERLNRIKILGGRPHSKNAQKRLELLKKEIKKGNIDDVTFGGNYTFSFKKLDNEYDDRVYCP
jgi:hypothetical protein